MKKQRCILIFLCLLLLAALPATANAARAKKVVILYNGEVLDPKTVISIEVGDTIDLTAEVVGNADPEESNFSWKIGNSNIACIDGASGAEDTDSVTVEGIHKGLTTVTVFSKSRSAKYSVNIRVINASVESIEVVPDVKAPDSFDPDEDALIDKGSLQLRAIVSPENADIKSVTWKVTLADCSDPLDKTDPACTTKPPATITSSGKLTASGVSDLTDVKVWAIATDGTGVTGELVITLMPMARRLLIFNREDIGDYSIEIPAAHADPYHFWACQSDDPVCYNPDLTNKVSPIIKDLTTEDKYVYLAAMLDWGIFLEDTRYGEDPDIISWSSSNRKIAEVDRDGRVTFYNAGTVNITAKTTDGSNLTAVVQITARIMVEHIEIHEIRVPEDTYSLAGGHTKRLQAVVYPSTATIKKLEWWTSDPAVATVSGNGTVTAAKVTVPRTVTIYAKATDADSRNQTVCEASYDITVYPAATSVKILDQTGRVVTGKTLNLDIDTETPYYLRARIEPLEYAVQDCIWKSGNKNIAEVDQEGNLILWREGTVTISAWAADGSNLSATVKLVISRLTQSIVILPEDSEVRGGDKMRVYASLLPNPTKRALRWYSTDTDLFTVSGNATSATITAKNVNERRCAYVYAEAADGSVYTEDTGDRRAGDPIRSNAEEICVYPSVRSVNIFAEVDGVREDITGRTYYLTVGQSLEVGSDLEAEVYPDTSKPDYFNWSSSSGGILYFDGSSFTALRLGTTKIVLKAYEGNKQKSGSITVKVVKDEEYWRLPSVIYSTSEKSLTSSVSSAESTSGDIAAADAAVSFGISGPANAYPGDTVSLTTSGAGGDIYWFSSNEGAAAVDNNGNVKISETAEINSVLTITALVNDGKGTNAVHEITVIAYPETTIEDAGIPAAEETTGGEAETTVEVVTAAPQQEEDNTPAYTEEAPAEWESSPAVIQETPVPSEETVPEGSAAAVSGEISEETETNTEDSTPVIPEEPVLSEEPEADETTAEPEIPPVEGIYLDIENDTVKITAGQTFRLESYKLIIAPADADWNTLTFEIENEYPANLESDEIANIRVDGLQINALAAGETNLIIKAGNVEKVIRIIVEAAPMISEEPFTETPVTVEEPVIPETTVDEEIRNTEEGSQDVQDIQADPAEAPEVFTEVTETEEPAAEPISEDMTVSDNTETGTEEG